MECPICLGPLNRCPEGIEDNVRRRLAKIRTATCCCTPCGHIFHKACLLTWLDQSNRPPCPVCNVKLSKMKLYPAYLNVDKEREGSGSLSAKNMGSASWMGGTGHGSVSSTATSTVSPSASVSNHGATNPQAIAGSSAKLSSITPGGSGLATMTIGAYALTTFGPLSVVAATAIGAPPGASVPRLHPQLGDHQEWGSSSAFVAFPQPSIPTPMQIAMSTTSSATASSGSGAVAANRLTLNRGLEGGNDEASTAASVQFQHQVPSRVNAAIPSGFGFSTAAQPETMWSWDISENQTCVGNQREILVTPNIRHRSTGGDIGCSGHDTRYAPYRVPPPAHTTSSLPRRITNIFDDPGHLTEFSSNGNTSGNSNAGAGIRGVGGRSGEGLPPRMYVHTPNVHEYQIQTKP